MELGRLTQEVPSPAPFTRQRRIELLPDLLAERILVIDGAMGTMLQSYQLSEAEFRGARDGDPGRFAAHPNDVRGNNDLLSLTQPQIVRDVHRAYLDAGADIIETN